MKHHLVLWGIMSTSQASGTKSARALAASEGESLETLLTAVAGQDREAFAAFYDRTAPRLYALALRLLRSPALAEEVVQDSYLVVWQQSSAYDPARGRALSWALTICHRRAVDRVRSEELRRAREATYGAMAHGEETLDFSDGVCERVSATAVGRCLTALSPKQHEALSTVYFDGLTVAEAARALDVPMSTVKTRLRDGLQRLRQEMRMAHV